MDRISTLIHGIFIKQFAAIIKFDSEFNGQKNAITMV